VARNAIKHGFFAREVVITAGDGEENLEEFLALVERLCECYEPIGVVEEMLVQRIATCWWRTARVLRAENGEIRKRLDSADRDCYLHRSNKSSLDMLSIGLLDSRLLYRATNEADQKVSTKDRLLAVQRHQSDLKKDYLGLAYLNKLWSEVKCELANKGHISKRLMDVLLSTQGVCDHVLVNACFSLGERNEQEKHNPPEKANGEECDDAAHVVWLIDHQLEMLELLKEPALESVTLEPDAETRSLSLPPEEATDKLLRYEAHLDRQLYRAMDQLERLQRQRKGEKVPPPLHINLGRRG